MAESICSGFHAVRLANGTDSDSAWTGQTEVSERRRHSATHAVDGVALAASQFIQYEAFQSKRERGYHWAGKVNITSAPFVVIRRPPISRRQLLRVKFELVIW